MLPGLRLTIVSFLCGFVVVFVGLRAVFSLNTVRAGLPVMAAQAAQSTPPGMIEPRGTASAMPALYDLRLVGSAVTPQFASLTVPIIERILPDPLLLIENAFRELPPAAPASEPAPQADAALDRSAAIAAEPAPAEPPAAAPAEPPAAAPAEPPAAAPAEPPAAAPAQPQQLSDSAASEPPLELLLQPISQPTAPVESRVAAIFADPDATTAAVDAPKPAEARLVRAAAKPVRKKRARVVRRAPPQNELGNPGGNSFGNPGGNSFGKSWN